MPNRATTSWLPYLLRSVGLGLVVAAIVIIAMPHLQGQLNTNGDNAPATYATAVNRAAPAVVNIYSVGEVRGSYYAARPSIVLRLGSGVIYDNHGHIITAAHVVSDVDSIQIALQDGRTYAGQVIGIDTITDLAVLRIEADNLPVIPQQENLNIRTGDVVLAIGNPLNLGQTITQGIISATGGRMGLISSHGDLLQMDAVINEGASGGALVNSQGYLVGINNAQFRGPAGQGIEGIYFAVPYELVKRVVDVLIRDGEVVRGHLGVSVNDQQGANNYSQPGIFISAIEPGSPADQAGLRPNDYIFEIGGKAVTSVAQGMAMVANTKPGTKLKIQFYRGNQAMETTATIARLPN